MMKTMWWCERCHASGLSDLEGVSVYDALNILASSHDHHVLAERLNCLFNTATVRVAEAAIENDPATGVIAPGSTRVKA